MKQKTLRQRALSLLLAAVMALTLAPAARAATTYYPCPSCGQLTATLKVIKEANCHEEGVNEYTCTNPACVNKSNLVKVGLNPNNHDATYRDNGDGTHSGVCTYHTPSVTITNEAHTYNESGICTKCLAVNYSEVQMALPENLVVYASLDAVDAALSLGDVRLTIGNADITSEYTLSYNWYYESRLVGSETTYTLPTSITSKEGNYQYVCFVMAMPKSGLTHQPISASCTVTVRVEDLITSFATVGRSSERRYLGDGDTRSAQSVEEQIYEAVYAASDAYPSYVVFGAKPTSTVGDLELTAGMKYYFDLSTPAVSGQSALKDVSFRPYGDSTGTYVISFTAYDTKGQSYPGMLTITVTQYSGNMDILYTTSKDTGVTLTTAKFEDFWRTAYSRGSLTLIRFTSLPASGEGSLYIDYASAARPGTRVKTGDSFYAEPGGTQYGIDEVTFLPGVGRTGYIVVPFEAYGSNNAGRQVYLDGSMYILVSTGEASDVTWRVTAGTPFALNGEDILNARQSASGTANPASIQFLDVPASGALYNNYANSSRSIRLTGSNISDWPFYFSGTRGDLISGLTYVPGTAATETVRYLAYDAQGRPMYTGSIQFLIQNELAVEYSSTSAGVTFKGEDFGKTLVSGKLSSVSFTPPASNVGTLYYDRSGTSGGTAITSDALRYYITAPSGVANVLLIDKVTFVPARSYSGIASIPFAAYDESGTKISGTVKITVTATQDPTTTPPPTVTQPTVTFSDVPNIPSTAWYYTAVTDLATAGVIAGYPDGTFQPDGAVTYGEALKMIMLAAGYPEPVQTDKHWASGYLSRALADGLLSGTIDLDRRISRYAIAEIAAKALKLPASTRTVSPFTDMKLTDTNANYVLQLYEPGIIIGTEKPEGSGIVYFYGVNAIRRSEMAVIIWRINNYNRTGNVNG